MELLAPAGNREKLETAFRFGADACYFAGKKYGLRAFADNFDLDELKQSVAYAHKINKKAYITLNIIAHNRDFDGLKEYVLYLQEIKVDAVIVADIGIIDFIRQIAPNLDIHVSTQANITNKYSAQLLQKMGVKRLILARELSFEEIKEIRDSVPDMEIECFVHGSMCIAYSGRCLLSNYMTGRDSNCGACSQPCRWEYFISSKAQDDEYQIEEDERGTYILNSKDLCMIEYIDKLASIGIDSLKIEGRMKSPYYVATVVNAYRRAIDLYEKDKNNYHCPDELLEELEKTSHRRYTTGFYNNSTDREYLLASKPVQSYEFVAVVTKDCSWRKVVVEQRNKFQVGDTLQVLSPNDTFNKEFVIKSITDENGNKMTVADKVQQSLTINCPYKLKVGDILRRKIK